MIPCSECGHVNPFGTRFCRSCGARMKPGQAQVVQAVADNRSQMGAEQAWKTGIGWLTIGAFLLLCAVLAYTVVVPAPPVAVIPVPESGPVPAAAPKAP